MTKLKRFDLVMMILSALLIIGEIIALCGFWYNDGNILVLIAAICIFITSVVNFFRKK